MTYHCRIIDCGDEPTAVESDEPDLAAEQAVEQHETHEAHFTSPEAAVEVEVTAPDGTVTRWMVWSTYVLAYNSRKAP